LIGSPILSLGCLAFIIVGAGIVGTQSTWRETIAGLGIQYVGVATLLGSTSGLTSALAGAIAGAGVTLLFASGGYFSSAADLAPATPSRSLRGRAGPATRAVPQGTSPWSRSARQIGTRLRTRPFDASVFALAVVAAHAVAAPPPRLGSNLGGFWG
jgi:hypothetical protein